MRRSTILALGLLITAIGLSGAGSPVSRKSTPADRIPGERLQLSWSHGRTLRAFGLAIRLPHGWTGQIYRRLASERSPVIVHVANFKLGPPDGYDPEGGVLIHGRIVTATSVMTPKDFLITLFD